MLQKPISYHKDIGIGLTLFPLETKSLQQRCIYGVCRNKPTAISVFGVIGPDITSNIEHGVLATGALDSVHEIKFVAISVVRS